MFGGFGGDPFEDVHRMMRRQMQQMDNLMGSMMGGDPFMGGMGMGDPFMRGQQPAIQGRQPRDQMLGEQPGGSAVMERRGDPFGMMPFGFGGGMFGGMMHNMDHMRQRAENDPNSHVYSHSTVIRYDGSGEQPRYYESTNSTRKAGHVKEVRKTVRDSERGEDKMSIEHRVGDRAHVIEKKRDREGQMSEHQEFVNLDESQAHSFDREFAHAARKAHGDGEPRQAMAIEGRPGTSTRYQEAPSGPIIEEVDDERPESSKKRRKGMKGKLFHA